MTVSMLSLKPSPASATSKWTRAGSRAHRRGGRRFDACNYDVALVEALRNFGKSAIADAGLYPHGFGHRHLLATPARFLHGQRINRARSRARRAGPGAGWSATASRTLQDSALE